MRKITGFLLQFQQFNFIAKDKRIIYESWNMYYAFIDDRDEWIILNFK
jgi:hypothetical protein